VDEKLSTHHQIHVRIKSSNWHREGFLEPAIKAWNALAPGMS